MAYDNFHEDDLYGKVLTKKAPIRMFRFTSRLPCHIIWNNLNLLLLDWSCGSSKSKNFD